MAMRTHILPERYHDAELIARGAMGDIYCATDSVLGRVVALKLLAAPFLDDESVQRRFSREARAAARLSSDPNIVTIFDVGESAGQPYIVMEYMSGGSLEKRLRTAGTPAPAVALRWLEQAAQALDHAHAQGVVHRDVKPGNLLLDAQDHVHVADFGIASAAGMATLTSTGTVLGTAGYIAPEQASGVRATPASDRYGLAAVAYELLTGRRPFESESSTAEAAAHVSAPIPLASEHAGLPVQLDAVFRRGLAKRPENRYATCAEFVAALRAAFDSEARTTRVIPNTQAAARTTRAAPAPPAPPARPTYARRRGTNWPLVVAVLGALAAAGVVLAVMLPNDSKQGAQTPVRRQTTTQTKPKAKAKKTKTTPAATRPTTTAASEPATTAASEPATTQSTPPATTQSTPPPTPAAVGPHTLNDQAWALMKQGRYTEALPLLQQAVPALRGAGPSDLAEGYANDNLGYTLLQLGRCDEAKDYLNRAKHLEPDRTEVDSALAAVKECRKAGR